MEISSLDTEKNIFALITDAFQWNWNLTDAEES